jgi:hypothetical protein
MPGLAAGRTRRPQPQSQAKADRDAAHRELTVRNLNTTLNPDELLAG